MLRILVVTLSLLSSALACSTTSFDSTYEPYPDCAAPCLACQDPEYSSNFANNCDYSSGECCTSLYHNAIAETWSCARVNCGDEVSKEAFATFVESCKQKGKPLEQKDVPEGYEISDTGDGKLNLFYTSAGLTLIAESKKPALSTGQIVGIVVGSVTCIATIIGVILRCRHYRRKKKNLNSNGGDNANINTNHLEVIHQPQGLDVGTMSNFFRGNDVLAVTYTRNTSTTSLTHGRMVTKEVWEVKRAPGRDRYNNRAALPHRVIEEVD